MRSIRKIIMYTMFFSLLPGLSSCNLENITKLVTVSSPEKRACIMGIWPAVQENSGYSVTETDAYRFVINVQTELKSYRDKYKEIRAERLDKPKQCNNFLNHKGTVPPHSYANRCMVPWGQKSRKRHESLCPISDTYLIGAIVTKGKAKPYIVGLNKPHIFANKEERVARGKDLNRLARNLGILLRKELQ